MKQKLTLFSLMMFSGFGLFAQAKYDNQAYTKKGGLFGVHFNVLDTYTPKTWKSSDYRNTAGVRDLDFGFSLSYWKGLTNHLDLSTRFNVNIHDYAFADRNEATTKSEMGLELEPALNLHLLRESAPFNPFLTVGIGGGYYTGDFGAYVPTGVGLQFNFNSVTYLMVQAQYRWTLTEDVMKDNLYYSVGLLHNFAPEKPKVVVVPPPPPPVILDRDGDGINDVDDRCPDVRGLAALQGCPDGDGDGIADAEDKCPSVAGLAKYGGCPIPDTDGDGINDEQDKCVDVRGVSRYMGCPVPDKDKDGVADDEDKCPNVAGPADNFGCPTIGIKSYEISFKSGSAVLLPKGKATLDVVAEYLLKNDGVSVSIDGHTDNSGTYKINDPLSLKRAESSKAYLVSKGIDANRMTTAGYGSKQPIEDNKTPEGRMKNRRIEIKIRQ